MKFPSNSNYDVKIVREMGPRDDPKDGGLSSIMIILKKNDFLEF